MAMRWPFLLTFAQALPPTPWQTHAPGPHELELALDLDLCQNKDTNAAERCPDGTILACWSFPSNSSEWWCLGQAMAGKRAASGMSWDVACSASGYAGACTFGPGATTRKAPALRELLGWEEAQGRAAETLELMTLDQKTSLLQGSGWEPTQWWYDLPRYYYVGNTPAIPALGLPSLNMQDATDGFRPYWPEITGTVTVWPSVLAMAATWDPISVQDWAVALGKEFHGKGANVILGPGVQVQRVARCGRSFEYLSGDDPYLGAELTRAYVKGVQSQGVMAIMKHWVFNSQETHRGGYDAEDSIVDNKTARELYFPPFVAAIEAGVGGAMCSYNFINGVQSCSNQHMLTEVLKGELNFQGFVQSDWWAVLYPAFMEGLDQEMPGKANELFLSPQNTSQYPERVDDAVKRILSSMYKVGLPETSTCSPPNCTEWFTRDVSSSSHKALAHSLAAESIVLLQNTGDVLPLGPAVKKIAIIGSVADSASYDPNGVGQGQGATWHTGDYYSGGGSGHLTGNVSKTLDALRSRAALAGIEVLVSSDDDVATARRLAAEADVAFVVVGATSGESVDRPDLQLENGGDALIEAVAANSSSTVVLMQICGAVLTPWRDQVHGILAMFLGGEATGTAWASVIFGDVAPSGRLPIMLPESENDTIPPSEQRETVYSEGLATSYRNTSWKAAFAFGYGLSYSQFQYGPVEVTRCPSGLQMASPVICIQSSVQNVGTRASRTVAQLYLEYPAEAEQPVPILKGFQKTVILQPGANASLVFPLSERDLSYWNGDWRRINHGVAHLASSSAHLGPSVAFTLEAATSTMPASTSSTAPSTEMLSAAAGHALLLFPLLGLM